MVNMNQGLLANRRATEGVKGPSSNGRFPESLQIASCMRIFSRFKNSSC